MIYLKTEEEIEKLREADLVVARTLGELAKWVAPGITTRKLDKIADEYIRSIRMKKAALLLQNGNFTVSEAMFMVGFSNTSYFSKAFTAQFGMSPREYRQSFRDGNDLPE